MNQFDVRAWLQAQQTAQPVLQILPGASEAVLLEAERAVGPLPPPLRGLLGVSNGLVCGGIRVYSAYDDRLPKKTWESLQRANTPGKTEALGGSAELLQRFLVFADVGNCYLAMDRTDGSIWFQEVRSDSVEGTTLTLFEVLAAAFADYG